MQNRVLQSFSALPKHYHAVEGAWREGDGDRIMHYFAFTYVTFIWLRYHYARYASAEKVRQPLVVGRNR